MNTSTESKHAYPIVEFPVSYSKERDRIIAEYERRAVDGDADQYAPWQPAEAFMRVGRERAASQMLRRAGVFPVAGGRCLEVGYGRLGWLGTLVSWGLRVSDLSGIELDEKRGQVAQRALPGADLRIGDASELPWPDATFNLVVCSTVFTSILDVRMQQKIAGEITRVLVRGGALLWYDFRTNNPKNKNVQKVSRSELARLFPELRGAVRSVTLAPPLTRLLAPRSWGLASVLESVPPLRTHLLGVLLKVNSPQVAD